MAISFVGKVALVTGAGKGIGRCIAKTLSEHGAKTMAISRTQADLDRLKFENPDIQVHRVDVANWEETRELVRSLAPVDLLVNNAGISKNETFIETSKQSLDEIFEVNFKSIFNISQVVAESMLKRGVPGSIVNMSSITHNFAAPGLSAYSSSKAAIYMLTRSMATELGPRGIRVNSISPGMIWTQALLASAKGDKNAFDALITRTPLGRFQDVDDISNMVVFLLSDKAGNITGENINIDGGLTID